MRASAVSGIVFANVNDSLLKKLTSKRSIAAIPFGARYRLIDFALSNLVNAGVTSVGIITKENYRSLMDHVGNGSHFELDRKNGGIYILPPYLTSGMKRYSGTVDALYGAKDYIKRCGSEYIVLYNSDVLMNVDLSKALKYHIDRKADVTILYSNNELSEENRDNLHITVDENSRVKKLSCEPGRNEDAGCAIGVTIVSRKLLLELIYDAYDNGLINFSRDVLINKVASLNIYGYEHDGCVYLMNGMDTYFKASMDLLKPEVRHQLFDKKHPILTKTRDDMPTRYGTKSVVNNSLIADGCIIEGTVKNSILFRGVKVAKGAVVENCILMQESAVGENTNLSYVISDKNGVVGENMVLKGTSEKQVFVKKNEAV